MIITMDLKKKAFAQTQHPFIIKALKKLGIVTCTFNFSAPLILALLRQRQVDLWEFQVKQGNIVKSLSQKINKQINKWVDGLIN